MYPLGFVSLSSYLSQHGYDVRIVNIASKMLSNSHLMRWQNPSSAPAEGGEAIRHSAPPRREGKFLFYSLLSTLYSLLLTLIPACIERLFSGLYF
jgi:hypothetical protein